MDWVSDSLDQAVNWILEILYSIGSILIDLFGLISDAIVGMKDLLVLVGTAFSNISAFDAFFFPLAWSAVATIFGIVIAFITWKIISTTT